MAINKQLSLVLFSIILIITVTNAGSLYLYHQCFNNEKHYQSLQVTSVIQTDKTLTITYSPMNMLWFSNELRLSGYPINIMLFCNAMYGKSPLICTLPSVPTCDGIRLYGTPAIGTLNLEFLHPFNCTVVA
ncbi:hypothetical protein CYY_009106 [Polysphondylium violaceum]|uniref:Transmembrane protein n=1 Tax=Polysphondylium violaceum TaxID=133409 RepID=A0A8J4PKL1_9MYCE|nr:hypothetical protein CYY_009106 [Polysphondylium violaceum]